MKKFIILLLIMLLPLSACSLNLSGLEDMLGSLLNNGNQVTNDDIITSDEEKETGKNEETKDDKITEDTNSSDNIGTYDEETFEEEPTNSGEIDEETFEEEPTIDEETEEDEETVEENKEFGISDPLFETRKLTNIDSITMDDFFNLGNRIDIKVTVSQEELNKLQKDYETGYKSDIYRLASKVVITLTNYGKTFKWEFDNVGIRQKGNTSRKNIIENGNLNLNHYKLSFDETFNDPERYDSSFINRYGNEAYKDREFLGMSGLDFKWDKNEDVTHIREIYASYLYRACGIMVQHVGLSNFTIVESSNKNKETSMGLCTVFEPASKSFIKRSLKSDVSYVNMADWATEKLGEYGLDGKSYGDLYKCAYGADLTNNSIGGKNIGVGNIDGSYAPIYDRKTHKDDEYNDQVLKDAIKAISTGDYDTISQYVDLEYLAISEAVGFVVGNPDSMRYNDNNFMIYMRRTDGKMVFIPIDNDRCFGIIKDWNAKDANMNLDPLDRKNSSDNNTVKLLLDTILARTTNPSQQLYLEFLNKIKASSWVDVNTFNTYFNMAKKSYSEHYFSNTDSNVNVTFSTYMNNKLKCITSSNNNNTNSNDNSNNNNQNTSTTDIYIVSSVNNWGRYSESELSKYKLQLISENTYQVTIDILSVEKDNKGNYFKFKFNDGYDKYDTINWTVTEDLETLSKNGGSSAKCYGVKVGDKVTITINIKTNEVSVVINGN